MENTPLVDIVRTANTPQTSQPDLQPASDGGGVVPAPSEGDLDSNEGVTASVQPVAVSMPLRMRGRRQWLWIAIVSAACLILLIVTVFMALNRNQHSNLQLSGDFGDISVPLGSIGTATSTVLGTANTLKVNGNLQVTQSILLTPTSQPLNPRTGQLFFDKSTNQLAYFNGQEIIQVAGTGNTFITNVLGGGTTDVRLQSTSPGVQQVGNFNISGVGKVGSLETTVINSGGNPLFINPTVIDTTPLPEGTPITIGLAELGGTTDVDPGWENGMNAQKVTLGDTGGKLQSISVHYIGGTGTSHVQMAVYEDDGDVPSHPGARVATTAIVSLKPNDWTTATLPAISLSPNTTYWLAVNTDDVTVRRTHNGGGQNYCYVFHSFGAMPDPFSALGCFGGDLTYPLYATFLATGSAGGSVSQSQVSLDRDGALLLRNSNDSSTAFQIQNAAGSSTVFNVDTINGRVAIGKANAAYKLDIAGGDINLSLGRSIRFGASPTLTVTGNGVTALSNLNSGGTVRIQGDSFSVQDKDATHANLAIAQSGAATFSNRVDSTLAFQIQNATGTVLLSADTTNMSLQIGPAAGSASPVVLYLAKKTTVDDPATGAEGGIYYNAPLQSFRCYFGGFWQNCGDIQPQHSFSLYDEFLGGGTSLTGQIGSLNWTPVAITTNGTLVRNPSAPPPSADRPGVLQIQTPATANNGTTLMLGDTSGGALLIGKDNDLKTAVAVGAATGQVLRIGLHTETSGTAQPVSGVWWEADPAANANWRYCYGNGTTATCAASTVAIAADTWVTLEVRITATGSGTSAATFVINNTPLQVSGVTIDTTGRVSPAMSCYATTSAIHTCSWDYLHLTGTTSAMR